MEEHKILLKKEHLQKKRNLKVESEDKSSSSKGLDKNDSVSQD